MGCIYILWNTVNNKAYVGQTKHDTPEHRFAAHLGEPTYYRDNTGKKVESKNESRNSEIAKDVEEYGKDAFRCGILYENIPTDSLDDYEVMAMQQYDTIHPNGYNRNRGPVKLQHKYNPKLLPPFVKGIEKYDYSEEYDEEYHEEVVYEKYQDYPTVSPWTDDGTYPRTIWNVNTITRRVWTVYDQITESWYTIERKEIKMSEAQIACVRKICIFVDSEKIVEKEMLQSEVAFHESDLRQISKELLEERTSKQWHHTVDNRDENARGVIQRWQFADVNRRHAMVVFDYFSIPENDFDGTIASRSDAALL